MARRCASWASVGGCWARQMVQHMQGAQAARLLQPRPGVLVPAVLDAAIGAVPRCCTAILKPKPHVLFHFPPRAPIALGPARALPRIASASRAAPREPGQYSAPGPGKQEKRVVADARLRRPGRQGDRRHVGHSGLHRGGRRFGRMRAGQPAERGRRACRLPAGGRSARPLSVDTHPHRLRQDHVPQGSELGLLHRSRSQHAGPPHLLAARPHAGRLQRHQWPDLYPGPARRLRCLGRRRHPAGAGKTACPTSAGWRTTTWARARRAAWAAR